MQTTTYAPQTERFAQVLAASKRVHWDIDEDVIRGRVLDRTHKYLPDGLTLVGELALSPEERLLLSQIQGRTYANMFGLVERFINAKVLELGQDYWLHDQIALEALIGFSTEEIKHQRLFRLVDQKDVFLFHWREESQHAIMDEIELRRHDAGLTEDARDQAVDEFIELVAAVDGLLQLQAAEDARYFVESCGRVVAPDERRVLNQVVLKAYRWQYILSGAQDVRFMHVLDELITGAQFGRITAALATLR